MHRDHPARLHLPESAKAENERSEPVSHGPHVRRLLGVCLDGYPFIGISLLLTGLGIELGGLPWSVGFGVLTVWVIWFFRDPERELPENPNAIVSPADGKVIDIREVDFPRLVEGKAIRVSIFMSVFNVHVNRIPCKGIVRGLHYNPGKYFAAYAEKASLLNEQSSVWLETKHGKPIVLVQIAGLVARRIINRLSMNEAVESGSRFGLIRFGSRCDLYLPVGTKVTTEVGLNVKAGASTLGELT
jgi:phosphatidylserine decarboxylase